MRKGMLRFIIIIIITLCLSACGMKESLDPKVLVLVTFQETSELKEQVALFNQTHEDYQIEVRCYERSWQLEEDGISRLQREIMSGKGPDLIDFGGDYTFSDVAGGYTENLMPYLEAEAEKRQEIYFTNVLDSFCYEGNLYAMPVSFSLRTFAGSKEALGGRDCWNIQEMMECYQEKNEGTILYPGETKRDVLGAILTGSMEYYIDWENGTCSFDQREFQQMLAFCNMFPDTLHLEEDFSVKQTFLDGGALIIPLDISGIYGISSAEYIFDNTDISYIGFPVEGVCGTVIEPNAPMLAICIGSRHKEIGWEFICQYLDEDYQKEHGLSISRSVMEQKLKESLTPEYEVDEKGNRQPVVKSQVLFADDNNPVDIYCLTKEQTERLMDMIDSATICAANDRKLYHIIQEEADSYFCGDKTLEEVTEIIQRRAAIYVSEKSH